MKHIILISITAILLFVSCKKDNDDPVVDQDNVRVHTQATYYSNGNLRAFTRYSYYQDGMIKSVVNFYVQDSILNDTVNIRKSYTDYAVPDDTTVMVITYATELGITSRKDTTILKLNSDGLYYRSMKIRPWYEPDMSYNLVKSTYIDSYMVFNYSIFYINDSLTDTNVVRNTIVNTIENGNCVKSVHGILEFNYEHYTDKVNTLNYGKSLYGRINKNPISRMIIGNNETLYNYEYVDGKISKVSYELKNVNQKMAASDSTISLPTSVSMPQTTYFTYLDFPF